jgi:UDP-N-acetylmuramoylalanine--D-glutamate ligase
MAYGDLANTGPDVAVLLNVTPNHLDRHPNMAAYAAAKLNMVQHMPAHGALILNRDDAVTARLIPQLDASELPPMPATWRLESLLDETKALIAERGLTVIPFSRAHALTRGAWLAGESLMLEGTAICSRREILLRGEHNISNLLAAMATVDAVSHWPGQAGADAPAVHPGALEYVARTFTGVPHRLEIVAQDHHVTWINDSIATSPERALAGLRAVADPEQTVILLAGGKDKNLPWDELASEIVTKVDFLIGFGQFGPNLVELVQDRARYGQASPPNCAVVQRLDEAVSLAGRIAQPKTIVLLSPGGTSYDMYKDFEARGEHFRRLVQQQLSSMPRNGSHQPTIGISTRL